MATTHYDGNRLPETPMTFFSRIDGFFFRRMSASGFGLMRICWAVSAFFFAFVEWDRVTLFYSDAGLIHHTMMDMFLRKTYHLTLLEYVTDPSLVFGLYLLQLALLLLAAVGYMPRFTVILSTLLMFSFHERNFYILGGGETVFRLLGFLLMIAPGIDAFSLKRVREQKKHWKHYATILPPVTMPAWPYRLLLWQLVVIYVTATWDKLLGSMWMRGTAVASALHLVNFTRGPKLLRDILSIFSLPISRLTLVFEASWALMLVPKQVYTKMLWNNAKRHVKYVLMLGGVVFHLGILIFMDAGSFPFAMLVAYLGILTGEDFDALRRLFNRRFKGTIHVLYDSTCGLCKKSMFTFLMLDNLKRLTASDFRDAAIRKTVAPDVSLNTLDKSMHIKLPSGKMLKGFYAFRELARHMPVLWPVYPLLFIPGVPYVGKKVYARVAERRKRCAHENCNI